MQPPVNDLAETTLDRVKIWAGRHQPYVRLVILASGLGLFLTFLPSYIRDYFWNTLVTNRLLEGMILVF